MVLEVSQETHLFFEQLTEACNLTLDVDDPATFFPRLYKFCEQILYFKDALDNLNRMFLDDREQCVLLEKKAVVLLDCATRATIDYMRSIGKHEQAAMFEIQLVEYKLAYKGVISVFIFLAYGNLKKAWEDLTDALKCQPFEQLEKFKSKLSSVFEDIEAEYHYFRRIQVTREWYSFSRLATFATIYNPKFYNQNREILAKEGRLLEAKILDIRSEALGKVIDLEGDPVRYADNFKIGVYKVHVKDIYSYIKLNLSINVEQPKLTKNDIKLIQVEGKIKAYLQIDDRKSANPFAGDRLTLLNHCIANIKARYAEKKIFALLSSRKKGNDQEKAKDFFAYTKGDPLDNAQRERLRDIIKGINKRIKNECGFKKFLIYEDGFIFINPLYLR